ncbi:MAG: site-specific integrase, partial [Anaerolineae bacterium]|nr:site-specific integrase [Anaerolineae bacterium]
NILAEGMRRLDALPLLYYNVLDTPYYTKGRHRMAEDRPKAGETPAGTGLAALTPRSSLVQAARAFELYMRNESFSQHTIRAFRSDLRLLGRFVGQDRAIGAIATVDLTKFLRYLLHERGVPCSPKSYARRVTTLKVFFKWLHKGGVLPEDPAAPVIQQSVETPLPEVLTEDEIARALAVTRDMWSAPKPDPRPHLLIQLLLDTAMKKSECMALRLEHVHREGPDGPYVQIRYDNPARMAKERKLSISPETLEALDAYLEVYEPTGVLFPCTARNLEYVLSDVAERAEIEKSAKKGISFELLRWTATLRDHQRGMPETRIRQKLGISQVTWQQTRKKLDALTAEG